MDKKFLTLMLSAAICTTHPLAAMNEDNDGIGHSSPASQSIEAFKAYFKQITHYGVTLGFGEEFIDFEQEKWGKVKRFIDRKKILSEKKPLTTSEKKDVVFENLIKLAPSLSHFYVSREDSQYTYLEELFEINLGAVAEKICFKIKEGGEELPPTYEILLKIYQGENLDHDFTSYSLDYINLAYKTANHSRNINMVNKLFLFSNVKAEAEYIKAYRPSLYLEYIHEPYWSYNLPQLQDYGSRIIEKIKPYFVSKDKLKNKEMEKINCVCSEEGEIQVRKVPFGYVLPNLYLRKRIEEAKDVSRAVPRIFLFPKGEDVKFSFRMPYAPDCDYMDMQELKWGDTGSNPMAVLSDDFVVYQEWIDGEGDVGDQAFMSLGHRDFNAVQIIKSNTDSKSYLIDTKEQKNFFAPCFSPFGYDYPFFPENLIKEEGITDEKTYNKWKRVSRALVYEAKKLHFDPRVIVVDVTIPLRP
jgi:hypothetical protein